MNKKALSEFDNTKGILLSDKSNEVIKLIKTKLRKTAKTIIEIGELLVEAIDKEPAQYKKEFYKQLGMSERSGQRYMQIAKNEVIQYLKNEEPKSLENMTMTDLLNEIKPNKKTATENKSKPDISKRAKNIFNTYKDEPKAIEEIISNLQSMLEKHKKDTTVIDAASV